jgi:hypothetical protein
MISPGDWPRGCRIAGPLSPARGRLHPWVDQSQQVPVRCSMVTRRLASQRDWPAVPAPEVVRATAGPILAAVPNACFAATLCRVRARGLAPAECSSRRFRRETTEAGIAGLPSVHRSHRRIAPAVKCQTSGLACRHSLRCENIIVSCVWSAPRARIQKQARARPTEAYVACARVFPPRMSPSGL